MKAMILAAGLGSRLGEITGKIPKALVEVNGKSILRIAVEKCTASGFDDIIVNVHHHAGLVEKEIKLLNREGFRISISDERERLLETGGGLKNAGFFFDDSPFLLYNADILTDIDLHEMYIFHRSAKGIATLAVRHREGNRFFLRNSEGLLKGWVNKSTGEKILPGKANEPLEEIAFSGIHIIEPEIFAYMQEDYFTMTSLYLKIASIRNIYTYLHDGGYWIDVGTPEKLEMARRVLKQAR